MRVSRSYHLGIAASAAFILSAVALPARALPVDDLWRGTRVFVRSAHATVEGNPHAAEHIQLSKGSGTLDLVLDARSLGIDYDAVFHLAGTVAGDRITWTFDEQPAAPWDLGSGVKVHRIRGKLVGRVRWLPGHASYDCGGAPCSYNVSITSHSDTSIEIHGESPIPWFPLVTEGWVKHVASPSFSLYAGMPEAALASLTLAVPSRFCSSAADRSYTGEVRLSTPAAFPGTWVDIASSDPATLVARRIRVREGETSARFEVRYPTAYSGTVVYRAAAGGVMHSGMVNVDPCLPTLDRKYLIAHDIFQAYGCASCFTDLRFNDRGDSVALQDGKWRAAPAVGNAVDLEQLVGTKVDWAQIDAFGAITFRATDAAGKQHLGQIPEFASDPKPPVRWLPNLAPDLVHDAGIIVGDCDGVPCSWNGRTTRTLKLDPKAVLSDAMTSGVFVGSVSDGKQHRGMWSYRDEQGEFGSLGGNTRVQAVNESGRAVGWAETPSKVRRAVYFDLPDWSKARALVLPEGAKSAVATGVAEDGTIVGTATYGDGSRRAFVALSDQDVKLIDSLLEEPNWVAEEALSISAAGAIVVRGQRAGKPEIFVLRQK